MKRITLSLLFQLCILGNAMAAEQTDSLMGLTGGVFDSFTGAPIEAKVCLLHNCEATFAKKRCACRYAGGHEKRGLADKTSDDKILWQYAEAERQLHPESGA